MVVAVVGVGIHRRRGDHPGQLLPRSASHGPLDVVERAGPWTSPQTCLVVTVAPAVGVFVAFGPEVATGVAVHTAGPVGLVVGELVAVDKPLGLGWYPAYIGVVVTVVVETRAVVVTVVGVVVVTAVGVVVAVIVVGAVVTVVGVALFWLTIAEVVGLE